MRQQPVEPGLQRRLVAEIGHPHRAPPDLVLVGRPDAAPRGADLRRPGRLLADAVEVLVQRQDQRRVLGDHQVLGPDRHPLPAQLLDLAEQRPGVEHHAVADDAELARPHDARGQQRQLVDRAVDDQRMPGIVPALEARDHVGPLAQPVDDLALALVAPLRADDHHVAHAGPLPLAVRVIEHPAPPANEMAGFQIDPSRAVVGCQTRLADFPSGGNIVRLVQPATREYRTWVTDGRRWSRYAPRESDIVIATYPKCGTTWMQRIVGSLVFLTPDPMPFSSEISLWIDSRLSVPVDDAIATIEAQTHRRFLKSHLPFDGLPIFDEVKYIHVARDGRDALMSWHNHDNAYLPEVIARLDANGAADETIGKPYPPRVADPRTSSTAGSARAPWPISRTAAPTRPTSISSEAGGRLDTDPTC